MTMTISTVLCFLLGCVYGGCLANILLTLFGQRACHWWTGDDTVMIRWHIGICFASLFGVLLLAWH